MKDSAKHVSMRWSAALFCVVILVTGVIAQDALVPTLEMEWNTIDSGGGTSEGEGFTFDGTIGQVDAAGDGAGAGMVMSGGGFEFNAGFWHGVQGHCAADVAPPAPGSPGGPVGTPGDGVVNVQDLLAILQFYGTSMFQYDIAPPGGDGVVNVLDLIAVIDAWGVCE